VRKSLKDWTIPVVYLNKFLGGKNGDKPARINIAVVGPVGGGKSTIVNSLCAALSGRYRELAMIGGNTSVESSLTKSVELVEVPDCQINFIDFWGYSHNKERLEAEFLAELRLLMLGILKASDRQGQKHFTSEEETSELRLITFERQIHGCVLVWPLSALSNAKLRECFRTTLARVLSLGVQPIILLTMLDLADPALLTSPELTLDSPLVRFAIEKMMAEFGMPESAIFPILPYRAMPPLGKLSAAKNYLLLRALMPLLESNVTGLLHRCCAQPIDQVGEPSRR
jgi:hypothetical protein